jgi:hypothetical protein
MEGENIAYSFQVPGWYMVLGLILVIALLLGLMYLIKYLRNAYKREALQEVENILAGEAGLWTYRIGLLLKSLAMEKYGKDRVAALQGPEWYAFLRDTATPNSRFGEKDFENFTSYTYNGLTPDRDLGIKLGDFASHWIKTHHAGRI